MQRLEVSCAVRLIYTSLVAKGLISPSFRFSVFLTSVFQKQATNQLEAKYRKTRQSPLLCYSPKYNSYWRRSSGPKRFFDESLRCMCRKNNKIQYSTTFWTFTVCVITCCVESTGPKLRSVMTGKVKQISTV
jgi:hypothetical protein